MATKTPYFSEHGPSDVAWPLATHVPGRFRLQIFSLSPSAPLSTATRHSSNRPFQRLAACSPRRCLVDSLGRSSTTLSSVGGLSTLGLLLDRVLASVARTSLAGPETKNWKSFSNGLPKQTSSHQGEERSLDQ